MKKIFTVIAISAAALLAVSCSNPSAATGGSGNSGSDPAGPTYIPDVSIRNLAETYTLVGLPGNIFFRLENVNDNDEIELIIVDNPNNITLQNLKCVWKKNDVNNFIGQYSGNFTRETNQEANIYFDFTPDKTGTLTYYIKDKTTNWYIDPQYLTYKLIVRESSNL